jgi:hypothetical protein
MRTQDRTSGIALIYMLAGFLIVSGIVLAAGRTPEDPFRVISQAIAAGVFVLSGVGVALFAVLLQILKSIKKG